MQSPKHALALQSEFKGVLYTPKLPINGTSGHYIKSHFSQDTVNTVKSTCTKKGELLAWLAWMQTSPI